MEFLSDKDIRIDSVEKDKFIRIQTVPFDSYNITSSFYQSISASFLDPLNSLELIHAQNIEPSLPDNLVMYQIPFENRGYGVKENSFKIEYDAGDVLFDDGNGNLVDGQVHVGNIFYNSGLVVISNTGSFASAVGYQSVVDELSEITFKRTVQFTEERYFINVDANKYVTSSNPTYNPDVHPHPYISNIYLQNRLGQIIAVARLNTPLPLNTNYFFVLEYLQ
jgi:hypothetical protein